MNNLRTALSATALSTLLVWAAPGAIAGAADIRSSEGGAMKFEYSGRDKLRINMDTDNNYMIMRDDEIYVVTDADGQMMVISMNQAMSMFAGMAAGATPKTVEGKLLSMKPAGRSETVAGIKGEVYLVRFIDEKGQERSADMVLSKDPRAVELQQAMTGMISSMARAAGKSAEGAAEMQKKLTAMNMGILRYGEDMWVSNISDRKIDSARFELPAEPTDLSALGGILGAASGDSGEEGGFVSGIMGALGGKTKRQEDRLGDQAEREVDKQSDNAVDNALNMAFGKLFGK
jgi:hypothetical protein